MTTPDATAFRTNAPYIAGEREMLQSWLDFHRGTLLWKAAGLTGAELAKACIEPSTMSLAGLIRHMTEVERWWFQRCLAGQSVPMRYWSKEWPDGDFDLIDPERVDEDIQTFKDQLVASDQEAVSRDLDTVFTHPIWDGNPVISLRWIYAHVIQEYARHNGHADLLRQRLDGATGE